MIGKSPRSSCLAALAAAVLAFGAAARTDAAIFGRTTIGAIASSGLRADYKRGSKFRLTEAGTVTQLCAYLDGNGGGPPNLDLEQGVRFALYRDAGGVPGRKLAEPPFDFAMVAGPATWICQAVALTPVSAGDYWIVIHSGGNAGITRYFYDGPTPWYGNADMFNDGPADQFGAGSAGGATISAYAVYTPASLLRHAGRTTVGTIPSAPARAGFKRASSFTLSEPGRLRTLSVYLDALGGASGTQTFDLALYRDANGIPGERVSQTDTRLIGSGDEWWGKWVSVPTDAVVLAPGRYWIALDTANDANVLRYYYFGEGTGNWYGNADAPLDQASNPFGPGSAGNGTISAFASYEPGNFVSKRFGRTDVGTLPSKGLTADFIRGSFFKVPDSNAALTGLYAYLDGNGGAAGSQQLRMALYDNRGANQGPGVLIGYSDVVTIPAGQAPGWVHFPVRAFPLRLDGYWIMLHSGATGGVVRDYGDGPPNWAGALDFFQDRPDSPLNQGPTSFGTVTMSVYGTYTTPAH